VLLGAHCSGGIKASLDKAEEIGAEAVQLFAQSPRAWRFPQHDPAVLERFRERIEAGPVRAALVHALYLVNLATTKDEIYEKSADTLCSTVDAACGIGADGVVFHVGSHLGAGFEAGLERVVEAMRRALDRCSEKTWLLMENSAGAGGTIGRSVDELATIFDRLDGHERLGVCLDSCHLFVSGCDVTKAKAYAAVLESLDASIGLDRLRALHVNDAQAPLGSNRDRHANIGEGLMGEKLGVFLAHPAVQDLPAVLEVPGPDGHGPDAAEIVRLRELHARWQPA
jgi:deoxyribonuclease IV